LVHYHQVLLSDQNIPFVRYEVPGSSALAEFVAEKFRRETTSAVILRNHGAMVVGEDQDQALRRCIILEDICRIVCQMPNKGPISQIIPSLAQPTLDMFRDYGVT